MACWALGIEEADQERQGALCFVFLLGCRFEVFSIYPLAQFSHVQGLSYILLYCIYPTIQFINFDCPGSVSKVAMSIIVAGPVGVGASIQRLGGQLWCFLYSG